ncbi:MAG: GNAT family N-acetyltransferase [Candidatus Bathyarchaeia archaeon]|jgi:ribosomal protein S18 acetylase RimI-like enzyme
MDVWQKATDNWSEFCVAMGCTRIRVSGALVHAYPINRSGSFYNSAFVQNPQSFVIKEVEQAYAERKLPFAITLPRLEPYEELGDSLEELEYSLGPPWMLMTLKELTGNCNPEVRVEEIDRPKLEDWFELQDAFPQVESSRPTRLEMIEKVSTEKSAQLLLASLQGRSVGAGLLFMKDQVASIHMIATLTSFRRRHVATTVTLEAVHRAKKERSELVWLRTRRGGTGERVYKKIGFEVFTDILSYTKTPQYEDSNLPPI